MTDDVCQDCGHGKTMHFDGRGCSVIHGNPDPAQIRTCGCGRDEDKVRAQMERVRRNEPVDLRKPLKFTR